METNSPRFKSHLLLAFLVAGCVRFEMNFRGGQNVYTREISITRLNHLLLRSTGIDVAQQAQWRASAVAGDLRIGRSQHPMLGVSTRIRRPDCGPRYELGTNQRNPYN